jgi:hypothetical protein
MILTYYIGYHAPPTLSTLPCFEFSQRYPALEDWRRILLFNQQKRQDIIFPFYLIRFAYLSFVRMY